MATAHFNEPRTQKRKSIYYKIIALCLFLLTFLSLLLFALFNLGWHDFSYQKNKSLLIEQTKEVVTTLSQPISSVEMLAQDMGKLVAVMDAKQWPSVIAPLLQRENAEVEVLSGHVWRDPAFIHPDTGGSQVDQPAYHWYQNEHEAAISLLYSPANQNSHYQESAWFNVAKILKSGQAFWSQPRIDPATNLFSSVCAVPYYIAGQFAGVITVRVRFPHLQQMLEEHLSQMSGYSFMLDRNHSFLSYPFPHQVINYADKGTFNYLSMAQFAAQAPSFRSINTQLQQVKFERQNKARSVTEYANKAELLATASDDISISEALLISTFYNEAVLGTELLFQQDDVTLSLLDETAVVMAFEMAKTQWTLVIAVPKRLLSTSFIVLKSQLFWQVLAVLSLSIFIGWIMLKNIISLQRYSHGNKDAGDHSHDSCGTDSGDCIDKQIDESATARVDERLNMTLASEAMRTHDIDRLNYDKKHFIEDVSSEIKTPISTILSSVTLLKKSRLSVRDKEYISLIEKSANMTVTVLNDVKDYANIMSGEIVLEHYRFDLLELLDQVYTSLRGGLDANLRIRFSLSYPENSHRFFFGDPLRLRQVLIDLVGNALKFTSRGFVELKVESGGTRGNIEQLIFQISDTGIGIPQNKVDDILNQTAENSAPLRLQKQGLTLSICHRLVLLMKGEMTVESKLGEGSIFTIRLDLPRAEQVGCQHLISSNAIAVDKLSGLNVLLIEDNKINHVLAQKLLNSLHINTQVVGSIKDGLQLIKSCSFNVIYLRTVNLMDDIAVLRAGCSQHIPIIGLTTTPAYYDAEGKKEGLNGIIAMPLSRQSFIDETVRVLGFESQLADVVLPMSKKLDNS